MCIANVIQKQEKGKKKGKKEKKKMQSSPAGNRTPVSRVTGGDTHHYTTEDETYETEKLLLLTCKGEITSRTSRWQRKPRVLIYKKHNKRFKSHVHLMTAYASTNRANFECVAFFL